MKSTIQILGILLLALTMASCASGRLRSEGDAAMISGRFDAAVGYYERALDSRPSLANDSEFVAKLRNARFQNVLTKARGLASRGDYEGAVRQFKLAVEVNPDSQAAADGLDNAKKQASIKLHGDALRLADNGKLDQAIQTLRKALEYDPDNRAAQDAMDSVDRVRREQQSKADRIFNNTEPLMKEKRWFKVTDGFTTALKLDPNHLPSRVNMHRAVSELKNSKKFCDSGVANMNKRALDAAIADLEKSIQIWPFNTEATQLLTDTRDVRALAESHFEKAMALSQGTEWDASIAAANACLTVFPFHQKCRLLLDKTKSDAADDWANRGDGHIQANRLADAEAAFTKSLEYVKSYRRAKDGLANVSTVRGKTAEGVGNLGHALLWYMHAYERSSSTERAAMVNRMRAALQQRVGFTVQTSMADKAGHGSHFQKHFATAFKAHKPGYVVEVGENDKADYKIAIDLDSLNVDQRIVRSESRTHRYTEYRDVPNPRIPYLRNKVYHYRHDVHRWQSQYRTLAARCAAVQNDPNADKSVCAQANRAAGYLSRAKSKLHHYEHELHCAPTYVREACRASWPYQHLTYAKTGRLVGNVNVKDNIAQQSVGAVVIDKSQSWRDVTITNPNPTIGLREDRLSLPADSTVREKLIDECTKASAKEVVEKVLRARSVALNQEARQLHQRGQLDQSIELNIDATIILESTSPGEAKKVFRQLGEQLRQLTAQGI